MYFKTLLLAAIGAFAMLYSTQASAQLTVDVSNHSPCDYDVEIWIDNGGTPILYGGSAITVSCCGTHVYPTLPAGYVVTYYKVIDAWGSNDGYVGTGYGIHDTAGDCNSGTSNVDLINATDPSQGLVIG